MLPWFVYNFLVLFTALFVILEKDYGASIGLLAPLAWIALLVTAVLLIQWFRSVHWVIIDTVIILMCVLVVIEKSFGFVIDFVSPVAWLVLVIMIILIAKDLIFMKIRR